MILKAAQVRSYKNIYDSELVPIESDITCMIGKNESGKSAFLEALYRLNPLPSGTRMNFDQLRDYPRRLRGTGSLELSGVRPIEAVFELENEDIDELEKVFGPGILRSRMVTMARDYENRPLMGVDINEQSFVKHVIKTFRLDITLPDSIDTVAKLKTKLQSMTEKTPAVQRLLGHLEMLDLRAQVREMVVERVPRFLYFSEYSALPGRISIPHVLGSPETRLSNRERTALALLRQGGMISVNFPKAEYEARRAVLESAAARITDEIFEFWSQNHNLRVDFDLDFGAPPENGKAPPFLDIRIWNDQHRVSLKFDERSDGFVWFFSFLVFFSEFRLSKKRMIVLLDEPGVGLHALAQADLMRFMERRLTPNHQIVYTTHSPFMMKASDIKRVRFVEDRDSVGTKVTSNMKNASQETVYPLQAAMDQEMSQEMIVGRNSLIVENPSDILYLQVISSFMKQRGRVGLDERWELLPAGSIKNLPSFVSMMQNGSKPAVLYNVNPESRQTVEQLVTRGLLPQANIMPVTLINGHKAGDLEDVFDPYFFLTLLRGAEIADIKDPDLPPGDRIVRRVEGALGKKLNRFQPASHLMREQAMLLEVMSDETLDRFEKLFQQLNQLVERSEPILTP